jgi:hypothetical protein
VPLTPGREARLPGAPGSGERLLADVEAALGDVSPTDDVSLIGVKVL